MKHQKILAILKGNVNFFFGGTFGNDLPKLKIRPKFWTSTLLASLVQVYQKIIKSYYTFGVVSKMILIK